MAKEAREEGFVEIAALFEAVSRVEKVHEDRYKKLLENVQNGMVFSTFICRNCAIYISRINGVNR